MKKILFITNIPNPYRQKFYNLLSQKVDLTVIYEAPFAQNIDFAQIVFAGEKKSFLEFWAKKLHTLILP